MTSLTISEAKYNSFTVGLLVDQPLDGAATTTLLPVQAIAAKLCWRQTNGRTSRRNERTNRLTSASLKAPFHYEGGGLTKAANTCWSYA